MDDGSDCHNIEMIYDLLLPDGLSVILNLHWDEQSPLRNLGDRHADLVSFRLRDCFLSENAGDVRALGQRVGGGFGKLPLSPGSVECIVLHHTLDPPPLPRFGRVASRTELMRLCKEMLAPGGVLAISSNNYWSVDRLRGALSSPAAHLPLDLVRSGLSLWGCRRLLRRAGFKVSEAFAVVPNTETPAAIISTQWEAAQVFYGRATPQMSNYMLHPTEFLVRLLNALNLRPYLEPAFFILARHD